MRPTSLLQRWDALFLVPVLLLGCSSDSASPVSEIRTDSGTDGQIGNLPDAGTSDQASNDGSSGLEDAGADATDVAPETQDSNKPPAGFLDPTSPNYITFEFKGLINSDKTVYEDSANIISGVGSFKAKYGDKSVEITTADNIYAGEYPSSSDPQEKSIVIKGMHVMEGDPGSHAKYVQLTFSASPDALNSLKEGDHMLTESVGGSIREGEYVVRKDGTVLYLICYAAISDKGSKVFVDHSANATFSHGENIVVWGNLVETVDQKTIVDKLETSTQYQGKPCFCYSDRDQFDCSKWDEEAAKDGSELSCSVPPDFLIPTTDTYAAFTLKGLINALDEKYPKPSYMEAEIKVGGQSVTMDTPPRILGLDSALQMAFMGNVQSSGTKVSFDSFTVVLAKSVLVEAKNSAENPIVLSDPGLIYAALEKTEGFELESGAWVYRMCPKAVYRSSSGVGSLYTCSEKNTSFDAGETLEMEANLPLQVDVTGDDLGQQLENGCYCVSDKNQSVACSTIPAQ